MQLKAWARSPRDRAAARSIKAVGPRLLAEPYAVGSAAMLSHVGSHSKVDLRSFLQHLMRKFTVCARIATLYSHYTQTGQGFCKQISPGYYMGCGT